MERPCLFQVANFFSLKSRQAMKQHFTRRQFISSSLLLGLSTYLGGWWLFKVRKNDITDIIKTMVRTELDYLQIDPISLANFSEDYSQHLQLPQPVLQRLSWMGMFSPLFPLGNLHQLENIALFSQQTAGMFLLSSDFFSHNSDTERVIKYVAIYDPYQRPCTANPFAVLTGE